MRIEAFQAMRPLHFVAFITHRSATHRTFEGTCAGHRILTPAVTNVHIAICAAFVCDVGLVRSPEEWAPYRLVGREYPSHIQPHCIVGTHTYHKFDTVDCYRRNCTEFISQSTGRTPLDSLCRCKSPDKDRVAKLN